MRYSSTRDKDKSITASEAIIRGISNEGGLFVPQEFPSINLEKMLDMDYRQIAYEVMSKYLTDFRPEDLKACVGNAYDDKFTAKEIAPLKKVGEDYFLELYHGPTLAFKDMALSILPHLLTTALKNEGVKEEIVILTATSGDTGKAALEGFANVEGIKIVVFFPENGVSQIQKLQMKTQEGDNTFVVGINGNFDHAQSGVKNIFNNAELVEKLKENNYLLSSANSINIGRLIPQITYYFHGYINLLKDKEIKLGDKINIVVPTGNFGNILAAYYAKEMGLPINKLICASNENNVLTEFINTGIYDRRRELILTSSPSMDILISSNLERLLYHLLGDDKKIDDLMSQLSTNGYYKAENVDRSDFYGDFSTEDEVKTTIAKAFKEKGYLMDTHTAVAFNVLEKYREKTGDQSKAIISSTASPFKFADKVASALELDLAGKDEFQIIDELAKKADLNVPKAIEELKHKTIRHENNCNKEEMPDMVLDYLKVGMDND